MMNRHYDTIIVIETIFITLSLFGIALIMCNTVVSIICGLLLIPLSLFTAIMTNKFIKHMNLKDAYQDFCKPLPPSASGEVKK